MTVEKGEKKKGGRMKDRSRRIGLIVKDYDRGRLAKAKPSGLFNVGAGGPR